MFKNVSRFCFMFLIGLVLVGCEGGKGSDFEGRWSSGKNEKKFLTPSNVIDIRRSGEMFHIDIETTTYNRFAQGDSKVSTRQFEGRAEDDKVLSLMGGLVTMRLQDGHLFYDGDKYVKLK